MGSLHYSNINQKIAIESKKGRIKRIKRGIYSDNIKIDAPVLANVCYAPSYLSFEYALYHYGLIPEFVSVYTSACFRKKNNVTFSTNEITLEYRSIPDNVFSYGIIFEKMKRNNLQDCFKRKSLKQKSSSKKEPKVNPLFCLEKTGKDKIYLPHF